MPRNAGVGNSSTTARCLDILQQMRLVYRSVPATETQPEKSKKGIYRISDYFLRFWFRYGHPYQNMLDLGMADGILENRVRPTFEQFVGYEFEDAARSYITRLARNGALSFLPERIGSWWDQTGEIDVVAVSETESAILVGECKWSVNPIGINILQDLQKKAGEFLPNRSWENTEYFLFSKSGYTRAVIEAADQDPDVHLVSVIDCLS